MPFRLVRVTGLGFRCAAVSDAASAPETSANATPMATMLDLVDIGLPSLIGSARIV